jgi:lysozyme
MKLHPRVTRSVVELVKRFEGLRRRAARLHDGGWTVGYGHTRAAREGAVVSPEDAEALLYYDLSEVAEKVEAWTFTPLNQNQFEALIAFAFNIGIENFRGSTVLKRVNEGQHLMAAAALELWRKADFGGEDLVVDALVRRRAAEKAHYLTPPEGFRPSPTPVLRPTFDHSVIQAAANSRMGRGAAIVDAPLDGDDATAAVERSSHANNVEASDMNSGAPGSTFEPAVDARPGLVAAKLHQLFPDRSAAFPPPVLVQTPNFEPDPPFTLSNPQGGAPVGPPKAMNDGPAVGGAAVQSQFETLPPLELPPAPRTAPPPFAGVFGDFAPASVQRDDAPPPFPADEIAPPPVDDPVANPAPLFDAPSARSSAVLPETIRAARSREDQPSIFNGPLDRDAAEVMNGHEPGPLHNRSVIFFSVGLLGVGLFAAAVFSMLSGKAGLVNLVIGLMGILLLTPAGGYFLMHVLNKRDGLIEA